MRFTRVGRCIRIVALLTACSSSTDVDAIAVSLTPLSFLTQEEWLQWPATPTIAGGEALVVRGTTFVGCGTAAARVQRRENVVGVEIRAVNTDRVCLASLAAWIPYEAVVTGLGPGTYRVRVSAAGRNQWTEGTATIVGP